MSKTRNLLLPIVAVAVFALTACSSAPSMVAPQPASHVGGSMTPDDATPQNPK